MMAADGQITEWVYERFRADIAICTGVPLESLRPETALEAAIPADRRRVVWQQLGARGYRLPPLALGAPRQLTNALSTLIRSVALAWFFQHPAFLAAIFPIGWLTWRGSRRFAVHVPAGCATVYEAAVLATPFRRADYDAGLWTDADVSLKVRAVIALSLGLALDDVKPESTLSELVEW